MSEGKNFISQYSVTRIIIDSDFDGVMCGAILRLVFPQAEILQSHASEIQEGKIDHLLNKETLIADLRYSPKAGFYFDHHESNRPNPGTRFIGSWKPFGSATHVVYDYFKDTVDLSGFTEYIQIIDKFDSGQLSLEEFKYPTPLIQLALVISRHEKFFNLYLVEMFARFGIERTCNHPFVKERLDNYLKIRTELESYIRDNTEDGDIVLVDISGYKREEKITSYLYTSQFPKARMLVVIKPHEKDNYRKIRFYRNNFYDKDSELDLLRIALKISPKTAGGHKGACGFSLKADFDRGELIEQIRRELQKQIT